MRTSPLRFTGFAILLSLLVLTIPGSSLRSAANKGSWPRDSFVIQAARPNPGMRELGGVSALLPFPDPDLGAPIVDPVTLGKILRRQHVDGISVRVYWRDFYSRQDDPGSLDWSALDEVFDRAERHGKTVRLAVVPGFYSPRWVVDSVPVLRFPVPQGPLADGNLHKLPVPWDETYLQHWLHFVDRLAERYGNRRNFSWISVAGPNSHNGEVNLPHGVIDKVDTEPTWRQAARDAGISGKKDQLDWLQGKLEQAWFECIDGFDRAFGLQCRHYTIALIQQSFPVDDGGGREKTYKDDLVAYGAGFYPHAFGIQSNGLNAEPHCTNSKQPHPWWDYILLYSGTLLTGFQTQDPGNLYCGPTDLHPGQLHATIDNAIQFQAHFIEIYSSDILDPAFKAEIKYAHQNISPFQFDPSVCLPSPSPPPHPSPSPCSGVKCK